MLCYHLAAGEAFCRAAELQVQLGSKHQAATEYVNAGTCYKKADPNGENSVNTQSIVSSFQPSIFFFLFNHILIFKWFLQELILQCFLFTEAINCLLKAVEIYTDMVG